jgi:hypothetical protein
LIIIEEIFFLGKYIIGGWRDGVVGGVVGLK